MAKNPILDSRSSSRIMAYQYLVLDRLLTTSMKTHDKKKKKKTLLSVTDSQGSIIIIIVNLQNLSELVEKQHEAADYG